MSDNTLLEKLEILHRKFLEMREKIESQKLEIDKLRQKQKILVAENQSIKNSLNHLSQDDAKKMVAIIDRCIFNLEKINNEKRNTD